MVYELKMGTRDEILQRIFDAVRRVNDAVFLRKVTFSIVEQIKMRIQADGGHFKRLLN